MLRVVPDDDKKAVRIYVWQQLPDGRREYETYDHRTKVIKDGETPPWVQVYSMEDAKALCTSLMDILNLDNGPDIGYLQGKLESMQEHLDDMRKLALPLD